MLKLNKNVRGLMALSMAVALTGSAALTGCSQRARLRLPSPADTQTAPGTNVAGKDLAPSAGANKTTNSPGDTNLAAKPADDGGIHSFGEKGAELLTKLEAARLGIALDISAMDQASRDGKVKIDLNTEKLISALRNGAAIGDLSPEQESYCRLMLADSRVAAPLDGEAKLCDSILNELKENVPATAEAFKKSLCDSILVVSKNYLRVDETAGHITAGILVIPSFASIEKDLKNASADDVDFLRTSKDLQAQTQQALGALGELAGAMTCEGSAPAVPAMPTPGK